MSEPILVLNCGSSSIKFAVFDAAFEPLSRKPLWSGKVEGIGSKNPTLVRRFRARQAVCALRSSRPTRNGWQRMRLLATLRTVESTMPAPNGLL
jgi:acetate kinase